MNGMNFSDSKIYYLKLTHIEFHIFLHILRIWISLISFSISTDSYLPTETISIYFKESFHIYKDASIVLHIWYIMCNTLIVEKEFYLIEPIIVFYISIAFKTIYYVSFFFCAQKLWVITPDVNQ